MNKLEPGFLTQQNISYESAKEYISSFLGNYYKLYRGEQNAYLRRVISSEITDFLESHYDASSSHASEMLFFRLQLDFFSKRWESALKSSRELIGLDQGALPRKAFYYIAVSLWKLGRREEAHSAFLDLKNAGMTSSEQKVFRQFVEEESEEQLKNNLERLPGVKNHSIDDFFKVVGDSYRFSDEAVHHLRVLSLSILQRLDAIEREYGSVLSDVDWASIESPESSKLIFTSGFSWSGSGAVSDYLRGYDEVSDATPGEIVWLRGHSSVSSVPLSRVLVKGSSISLPSLKEFYLSSVLGAGLEKGSYETFKSSVLFDFVKASRLDDLTTALGLLKSGLDNSKTSTDVAGHVSRFIVSLLLLMGSNERVLVNNGIMAPFISLANFFPESKFLVVFRDFRDQFCARAMESGDEKAQQPENFVNLQLSSLDKYHFSLKAIFRKKRIKAISFESFVKNEDVRRNVYEFLGFSAPEKQGYFNPDVSRRNIGIYKAWKLKEDVLFIEDRLGLSWGDYYV